ncbi:MAG TPA: sigma-54 dependent transcriptional regulator [Pirellulales bacterium]|jgi:DNA-binding NtrC family response regulator
MIVGPPEVMIAANHSTSKGSVLVVDDHAQARQSVADTLRSTGYAVSVAASAPEALNLLSRECSDVILTDLQMPGMNGLEFLSELARRETGAQVVMMTAHASVSTAVEAMRHGAFDYVEKPFDADRLERLIERAMNHGRLLDRQTRVPKVANASQPTLVGDGRAMRSLRERIARVAPTNETILIQGESGVGKELVARAVHFGSTRAAAPLVSVNCPALSAHLLESELFGHEKGAFTGADSARIGRFELADGGTILLDEVSEISLELQAKLLRVLQEKSFERVGSSVTRSVDVRVLATTNRDLKQEIAAGRFREDLYYRLAVVPLLVPPLRERREDIPWLIGHFSACAAQRLGKEPCKLDAEAHALLVQYNWPGNVRELENIITRASVMSLCTPVTTDEFRTWLCMDTPAIAGSIVPAVGAMAASATASSAGANGESPSTLSLRDMERRLIETTLDRFGGHRAQTAHALGIGLRTLSSKLKEYGYPTRGRRLIVAG